MTNIRFDSIDLTMLDTKTLDATRGNSDRNRVQK